MSIDPGELSRIGRYMSTTKCVYIGVELFNVAENIADKEYSITALLKPKTDLYRLRRSSSRIHIRNNQGYLHYVEPRLRQGVLSHGDIDIDNNTTKRIHIDTHSARDLVRYLSKTRRRGPRIQITECNLNILSEMYSLDKGSLGVPRNTVDLEYSVKHPSDLGITTIEKYVDEKMTHVYFFYRRGESRGE